MAIKLKNQQNESQSTQIETNGVYENIELTKIDPHPDNKNIYTMLDIDSLMRRIEESGFNGAIEVYLKPDGRYQISAGHRRYEAMKRLGEKTIPCIVKNIEDSSTVKKRLIESNINTRICSPIELSKEILYYESALLEEGYSDSINQKLSDVFNMSIRKIVRLKALSRFIDEIQEMALSLSFPYEAFESVTYFSKEQQQELVSLIKKHMEIYSSSELSPLLVTQCINQIKKEINLQKERENANQIKEQALSIISEKIKASDSNISSGNNEGKQQYTEFQTKYNDNEPVSARPQNEYTEKSQMKPFEKIDNNNESISYDTTNYSETEYNELTKSINEEVHGKNIDLDLSIYVGRLNTIVVEEGVSLSDNVRSDAIIALEKIIEKIKSI